MPDEAPTNDNAHAAADVSDATAQAAMQRIRLAVGRAIAVDDDLPLSYEQVAKAVELISAAAVPVVPGLPNLIREL
jgi:hypothetical protein